MSFSSNPNSYKGLAVPLDGESKIQQVSTKDVLTFEHSTANAGRFITFRDSINSSLNGNGSTLTASDLAWVNSNGVFVSANLVENASSASSVVTLTTEQNNEIIVVPGFSSGMSVQLPAPTAGLKFTIVQSTGHTSTPMQVLASSDVDMLFAGGGKSSMATTAIGAVAQTTAQGASADFIGLSAVRWLIIPHINVLDGSSAVAEASGGWAAVTS